MTREYYFNDAGAQIDRFTASLVAAATGRPTPQNGYEGDYIEQIAAAVVAANPGVLDEPEEKRLEVFRTEGIELMLDSIKRSLAAFGAEFDVYFSERDPARERRDRRGGRPAAGAGPRVRGRRRGLAAHRPSSATTRTGC